MAAVSFLLDKTIHYHQQNALILMLHHNACLNYLQYLVAFTALSPNHIF